MNKDGNWRKTTLGEVITLQRGFDLPEAQREVGPHPIVASTGLVGMHSHAMVKGPGVVIGRSGSLGGGQFIKKDFWPLNTTLWVKDFKNNDPQFCYFLLKSLDLAQFNVGSGVPTLNRNHIHPLAVSIPSDATEQRRIAHVLGTLDDRIENNRKTAKTLEAMAQAIFHSWFVDFDPVRAKMAGEPPESICKRLKLTPEILDLFPDRLVDSELGEIPEGWEVGRISQFGGVICGKTPSKANPEYFGTGIPFIKIPDMHNDMYVVVPSERLTTLGAASQAKKTIPPGSICVSCIATVGKVVITHEPSQTNQQINSVIPNLADYTAYLYFQMREKEKEFHDLASGGSTTLNMNTSTFSKVNVLMPSFEILTRFSVFVAPLFSEILLGQKESKILSRARDTILPKLISGEIRVAYTHGCSEEIPV